MSKDKRLIQYLLNKYLTKHGMIDIILPDGVGLQIGITQETKEGSKKQDDYCWVQAQRGDRCTLMDRYAMSMTFDDTKNFLLDKSGRGVISVL